jgi:hypothetical protein
LAAARFYQAADFFNVRDEFRECGELYDFLRLMNV